MAIAPVGAAPAPAAAPRPGFAAALELRTPTLVPPSRSTATPTSTATARRPHPALAALEGIERAQARLDGVLSAARAGRTFTASELLGLQAAAYRCTQTVDLAAKLVEQSAQAVRHALNTQL